VKIVDNIVLLARNVPIKLPGGATWSDTQSDWRTWEVIGVHGIWNKSEGGYCCPMILSRECGWMNVAQSCNGRLEIRDDNNAIVGDSFEENILDLQLKGEKNVFEIPLKIIKVLEERATKRGRALSFVLPFKTLKSSCKRII
jgi:hypothetical protein